MSEDTAARWMRWSAESAGGKVSNVFSKIPRTALHSCAGRIYTKRPSVSHPTPGETI
jgi:hypothetical protein